MEKYNTFIVGITSYCNAACPFCLNSLIEEKDKLEIDFFKYIKPLLNRFKVINFCGAMGDAIFHPDFLKIIEYLTTIDIDVDVFTNGSGFSKDWWKSLAKLCNDRVTFTFAIDGLSDTYSRYRINLNYERVLENLKSFIDEGGRAIWQLILFKHNEHQYDDVMNLAKDLGCVAFKALISTHYNTKFLPPFSNIKERLEIISKLKCDTVPVCYWREKKLIFVNEYGEVQPCGSFWPVEDLERFRDIRELYFKNRHLLTIQNNDWDDIIQNEYIQYVYNNRNKIKRCRQICKAPYKLSELIRQPYFYKEFK